MGIKVEEIASTHSGDKGDRSAIGVFVYNAKDWPVLRDKLTVDVVAAKFGDLVTGDIVRYELPTLHGLNFALYGALSGGRSGLRFDTLGKSYQSIMLDIELA